MSGRHLQMPVSRALKRMRGAQYERIAATGAGDLQPDGQALARKTARHRDRRQSQHIEWPCVAQHQQLDWTQLLWVLLKVGDGRRRNRRCGREQQVTIVEELVGGAAHLLEFAAL